MNVDTAYEDRMAQPPSELELVCTEFNSALDLLRGLGLRLDLIFPADDPHTAILSRDGTNVRLTSRPDAPPPAAALPAFQPEFLVTHAGNAAGEGRAGMRYRDRLTPPAMTESIVFLVAV